MQMTAGEWWATIHGILFGAVFLLGFTGGLVGLWAIAKESPGVQSWRTWMVRVKGAMWVMAASLWIAVITGTYFVYPLYRAKPPEGADLVDYPRFFLLDNPNLAAWHEFGMEWKEHVAWLSPILLTAAAYVIGRHSLRLARDNQMRQAAIAFVAMAFVAAGAAALFGALITRAAPVK